VFIIVFLTSFTLPLPLVWVCFNNGQIGLGQSPVDVAFEEYAAFDGYLLLQQFLVLLGVALVVGSQLVFYRGLGVGFGQCNTRNAVLLVDSGWISGQPQHTQYFGFAKGFREIRISARW